MIFQEDKPKKNKQDYPLPYTIPAATSQLGTAERGTALPSSQSGPIAVANERRVNAAEMVNLPSMTECTTKLFNESQEPD